MGRSRDELNQFQRVAHMYASLLLSSPGGRWMHMDVLNHFQRVAHMYASLLLSPPGGGWKYNKIVKYKIYKNSKIT